MKLLLLSLSLLLPWTLAHADLQTAIQSAAEKKEHAVVGVDSWLFLGKEMEHLAKGPLTAEATAPVIKAITAYHTALAAEGVQLIVMPVPAKAEIYPDKLSKDAAPGALAGRTDAFFKALETAGVEAINLAPAYQAERTRDPKSLLYCARDAHWSPAGLKLAADLVQAKIKDKAWFKAAVALPAPTPLAITGDLMTTPATQALGTETLTFPRITPPVAPAADAPALLLGDSHTLVFSSGGDFHCQGGGLLDLLQAATGQAWMQVANAGGGSDTARTQLARKAFPNPEFWKSKKVVVWCFSIREVTEKEWKTIPIKRG